MSSSTPETATSSGLSTDAFSSMFQALNGLRNRPALIAMVSCMFAGVLLFGLFTFLAARLGYFMAFLGGLAWLVAGATGVSAAGVLLMDQAKDVALRSVNDAIVQGLKCLPKFILLGLVLVAVALVVFVLLALVFFICRIPMLGPLLFVAVFPLSVVIAGLTVCGLIVCMLLALPAIWEGATITRAIAQALAIARSRLVETLVLLAVVGVLSVLVAFIVFGVLFSGLMPTIGMSASILGGSGGGAAAALAAGDVAPAAAAAAAPVVAEAEVPVGIEADALGAEAADGRACSRARSAACIALWPTSTACCLTSSRREISTVSAASMSRPSVTRRYRRFRPSRFTSDTSEPASAHSRPAPTPAASA